LLGRTKLITADQKVADVAGPPDRRPPANWLAFISNGSEVVALQSSAVLHRLLFDAAIVIGILLVVSVSR